MEVIPIEERKFVRCFNRLFSFIYHHNVKKAVTAMTATLKTIFIKFYHKEGKHERASR